MKNRNVPFGEMMMRNTRVVPVRKENKAKTVTVNQDKSMTVVQESGQAFTIPAEELELQAFVAYMMIGGQ